MIGFLAFILIAAVVGICVWAKIKERKQIAEKEAKEEAERMAFENDIKKLQEECKGALDGYQIAFGKCRSERDFKVFYGALIKDEDFWGGNSQTVFGSGPIYDKNATIEFLRETTEKFGYCTNNPYVDFIRHYLKTREFGHKIYTPHFKDFLEYAMQLDNETCILFFEKSKKLPHKVWSCIADEFYPFWQKYQDLWQDMFND